MRTNVAKPAIHTHEGAVAKHITPEQQLRRSVMSCLLWEREFYEGGVDIAQRITDLCMKVDPFTVAHIADEARTLSHLRHVPLLMALALVKRGCPNVTPFLIERVVQRADEMAEILSMYWADKSNKHMIPAGLRKGLQRAIVKFDEYALAKNDKNSASVSLRDVLRVVRPQPGQYGDANNFKRGGLKKYQQDLWKRAVKGELKTPDTWETQLSAGADKKETFTRLLTEGKLGYFALLRNLRNMEQAGVDYHLVNEAIRGRKNGADKILPFRFVAAARAAPRFEEALDFSMIRAIDDLPKLKGITLVMVDVSGSMSSKLSAKSDLTRMDAAAALGAIVQSDRLVVTTFSNGLVEVPARRGMAGIDAIVKSQPHSGTELAHCLDWVNKNVQHDRLIVITDEQASAFGSNHWRNGRGQLPQPVAPLAYMINVASAQHGVGYGQGWTAHIDGFSENVLRFIAECEKD
jgi:60 kDa SS-A/Ro ribonucleoprotein